MKLVLATEDYVYAGRPRSGFPLILGDDMEPAQPFHDFLHWYLLDRGKILDTKTWENYGRHLWDFSRYLHANELEWDRKFVSAGSSVLRVYRDWQAFDLKLDPGFINKRLSLVQRFYKWALHKGMIAELPYTQQDITLRGIGYDLAHATQGERTVEQSDLSIDEWAKDPVFLTGEQVKIAGGSTRATEHRLAFEMMARVGLRSIETRTFPLKYVFDPTEHRHLKPGTLIPVRLDPNDMDIKFDKPRTVHVPYDLMQAMHVYSKFERNRRKEPDRDPGTLLLTAHGNAYSKGSMTKIMADLGKKVGFPIRPLMLRHSYAIYTLLYLHRLAKVKDLKIEPLIYVRDRLGHANVQTTMIYLDQMEKLMSEEAMEMIGEFDRLYDVTTLLSDLPPQENFEIA